MTKTLNATLLPDFDDTCKIEEKKEWPFNTALPNTCTHVQRVGSMHRTRVCMPIDGFQHAYDMLRNTQMVMQ